MKKQKSLQTVTSIFIYISLFFALLHLILILDYQVPTNDGTPGGVIGAIIGVSLVRVFYMLGFVVTALFTLANITSLIFVVRGIKTLETNRKYLFVELSVSILSLLVAIPSFVLTFIKLFPLS